MNAAIKNFLDGWVRLLIFKFGSHLWSQENPNCIPKKNPLRTLFFSFFY